MKKYVYIILVTVAISLTGCGNKEEQPMEKEAAEVEIMEEKPVEAEEEKSESEEVVVDEQKDYLESVKEQSDALKICLEQESLTQTEMNIKSQELYELWDGALNIIWGELKNNLPEEEFTVLLDEQRSWIKEKEKAVEDAGKEVEGGSLYPLVVNGKAAELTEARVYILYELLK